MAEQLFRKQQVIGSNPIVGFHICAFPLASCLKPLFCSSPGPRRATCAPEIHNPPFCGRLQHNACVVYEARREPGHPSEEIVTVADSVGADLIVLGRRGLSEWKALMLGSVSDGVLHPAHCPVLIVRGFQKAFSGILLACDGSAGAFLATKAAGELAIKFGVPLTILVLLPLTASRRRLPERCRVHSDYPTADSHLTGGLNRCIIIDVNEAARVII